MMVIVSDWLPASPGRAESAAPRGKASARACPSSSSGDSGSTGQDGSPKPHRLPRVSNPRSRSRAAGTGDLRMSIDSHHNSGSGRAAQDCRRCRDVAPTRGVEPRFPAQQAGILTAERCGRVSFPAATGSYVSRRICAAGAPSSELAQNSARLSLTSRHGIARASAASIVLDGATSRSQIARLIAATGATSGRTTRTYDPAATIGWPTEGSSGARRPERTRSTVMSAAWTAPVTLRSTGR